MNIAGLVITFYPTKETFENIQTYLPYCNRLYIADNSDPNIIFPEEIYNNPKIKIIGDGENKGIAERLNHVARAAENEGFEWLLTMDQDSFFDQENITKYIDCIQAFNKKDRVAMFGIETEKQPSEINNTFQKTTMLITSGSILNLFLYPAIGGFDENLFIDEVDHEYCFRAIQKGFDIIKFTNIFLHHHLGMQQSFRSLKSMQTTERTFHSPIRLYYMFRNFLYISDKYKKYFPAELKLKKTDLLHRIKNHLLYRKQKLQLLKMLRKAYKDYKKNNMGKITL
ncbi:MAG: glycosyltransferase [Arachidicoccus sp.]|nr:glycosyltransferase [Arachidicoccus sp.]